MYFIGLDIGGTKIEAVLLNFGAQNASVQKIMKLKYQKKNGDLTPLNVLNKKRVLTERHKGYDQIIHKIGVLIKELCQDQSIHQAQLAGIGLSLPGPVDPITEKIQVSNSMIIVGHNMPKDIKDSLHLNCPIYSENDANCFALAETFCGAGLDYFLKHKTPIHEQSSIGLILGSGFGGGIIVDGKIVKGKHGGGGEVGHMTLYPNGHPCYCGRNGCAEQYLSGPALEASMNSRLYSQIENRPSASEIFNLFQLQDPIALAVVKQYQKDLAFYLGNLTNLIDPHYFILGGGLSLQNIIYDNLNENIGKNTFLYQTDIQVYQHKIGDSAGAIGAVLVVIEKLNI